MMNFTGQTNRRTVNMGSRVPRKTKDTILRNAELERIRRQREKAEMVAILTIQRHMRKRISNKTTYHSLIKRNDNDGMMTAFLKVFAKRLYSYLEPDDFIYLVKATNNQASVLPVLSDMLGDVAARKSSQELDELLILSVKPLDIPNASEHHINNKIKFIQNCSYELSDRQVIDILTPYSNYKEYDLYWNDLYFIEKGTVLIVRNYELFVNTLFSSEYNAHIEIVLERHKQNLSNFLINFLNAFESINANHRRMLTLIFMTICSEMIEPLNEISSLITDSFQTDLLKCFEWLEDKAHMYWKGLHYLVSQMSSMQRNSVFMLLLTDSHIRNHLIDLICDHFSDASMEAFSIFAQTLNFYIPLSPDDHLFQTVISRERLQSVSINIAQFLVSDILSSGTFIPLQELETFIELMWNLIYLDSRAKFLNEGTSTFWGLVPEEIHNLNIRKEILEFEQYYRDFLKNIEEMDLNEDELFDRKKMMDQTIKKQYLDDLRYKRRGASNKVKKLELLFRFPFMLKFFERVDYFNDLIEADKERIYNKNSFFGIFPGENRLRATIRRDHALEDAYNAYGSIGEGFKEKLNIQFINEFGPEAGIDGGGITKEFLQTLIQEAFIKGSFGLFEVTSFHKLYPSKDVSPQNLKYISFMGKVLGKCLYENILVDVEFADFFLKKILNVENNMNVPFNDLYSLDPEYYKNLMKLLEMSEDELNYMDLYFEVPDMPNGRRIPLIKDGLSVKVTQKNVFEYITRISHYKLNLQLYTVTSRFISGLSYMIPPHWLRMFTSYELKTLISGSEKDFDLEDLRKNTEYGGFTDDSITIQHFWMALSSFTPEERRKFLKFVFSVPTAPLKGFHSLNPLFGIRNAGDETNRLPTASTCINLLKLPDYKDYNTLREKLLTAINSDSRFELS